MLALLSRDSACWEPSSDHRTHLRYIIILACLVVLENCIAQFSTIWDQDWGLFFLETSIRLTSIRALVDITACKMVSFCRAKAKRNTIST